MKQNITVIGCGTMGRQIALNAAINGFQTYLSDASGEALDKAAAWAEEYLAGRIAKGRMSAEQVVEIKKNFHIVRDIDEALKQADVMIEAIIENLDAKLEMFKRADAVCKPGALLTSNSSSFVPSRYAAVTNRPDKVLGMHFFNPVLVMKLVEVIMHPGTSEESAEAIMRLSRDMDKDPILLRKECPSFVVNRFVAGINDVMLQIINEGICTPQEVDIACEKGLNHPIGPCKLMDLSGIDVHYYIRMQRYKDSGDEKDLPLPIVREMVEKGWHGRKTGRGWYDYSDKK